MIVKAALAHAVGVLGYSLTRQRSSVAILLDIARHRYPSAKVLFVDGGANVGQSLRALDQAVGRLGIAAEALSFEPISSNYQLLCDAAEQCTAIAVTTYPVGLSDQACRFALNLAPHSHNHSIANNDAHADSGLGQQVIELLPLDELLADRDLSDVAVLVKLNIEGHELQALEGMAQLMATKRELIVLVEVGFAPDNRQHAYFPDIHAFLARHGFVCAHIHRVMPTYQGSAGCTPAIAFADAFFCRA